MAIPINPFSTRFLKPGAQAFEFSAETSPAELVKALERHSWRGELVGPHGSGKSTLVADLLKRIPRQAVHFTIHSSDPLPQKQQEILKSIRSLGTDTLLTIDGMEQFSPQQRAKILQAVDRVGCGILVTCHHSVGLPCLLKLHPDLPRFRHLVGQLLTGYPIPLTSAEVDRAFAKYQPNIREALFSLYDIYETRRRQQHDS